MSIPVRPVYLAFLHLGLAAIARAQSSPIPQVPVSTITVGRAVLQRADTSTDLVVAVRDVDTPDRPLRSAYIELGAPGTDVRAHPKWARGTGPDGIARFATTDSATLDVIVLDLGYAPIRFTVRLARRCRQTVEVYLSRGIPGPEATDPPATPARVVLTTCWPPA